MKMFCWSLILGFDSTAFVLRKKPQKCSMYCLCKYKFFTQCFLKEKLMEQGKVTMYIFSARADGSILTQISVVNLWRFWSRSYLTYNANNFVVQRDFEALFPEKIKTFHSSRSCCIHFLASTSLAHYFWIINRIRWKEFYIYKQRI